MMNNTFLIGGLVGCAEAGLQADKTQGSRSVKNWKVRNMS
jgi:hypothetical protein